MSSSKSLLPATTSEVPHLTKGTLLAKNTVWNLIGSGAPGLIAIVAIPILIHHIGVPRFGMLTIVWTIVGYFTLFDFGMGTALTRMVADKIASKDFAEIPSLIWTSLILMLALGVLGAGTMFLLCPLLVHHILKIPIELQRESLYGFYELAIVLPILVMMTGLRGVLEAQQLFGFVNAVRMPAGALIFFGPLLVLPFSNSLIPIIAVLAITRVATCFLYFWWCLKTIPALKERIAWNKKHVPYIVKFGSWMTISNIISPVLIYMDRILIASVVSVAAVSYYATPFEVVSRLLMVPAALAGVLFPAFTISFTQNRHRMALLLARGEKYIFLIIFPLVLLIVTFANEGLRIWLGSGFAQNGRIVLQVLAVGVLINSLAQLPWVLIQGAGRPDLTAKFHLVELAMYLPLLFLMVKHFGIQGAAVSWSVRVSVDMILLVYTADTFLEAKDKIQQKMTAAIFFGAIVLLIASQVPTLVEKVIFIAATLVILIGLTWGFLLTIEERDFVRIRTAPLRHVFQNSGA